MLIKIPALILLVIVVGVIIIALIALILFGVIGGAAKVVSENSDKIERRTRKNKDDDLLK